MSITRRVSVPGGKMPDDPGFSKLYRFIKASLADPNDSVRTITTDQDYSFIIRTMQSSGDFEDRVVRIPKGQKLHMFRSDSSDKTNPSRFMFNEEDHAWIVNAGTGVVAFKNDNIHLVNQPSHGKFNGKISGNGLSLV